MAAQCGADTITACEAFKPMTECCLKILARNGVADKITVIPKRSTEIKVGEDGDMKEKANILVTEVFDTELIGEGNVYKHLSQCAHANVATERKSILPYGSKCYEILDLLLHQIKIVDILVNQTVPGYEGYLYLFI